MGQLKKEKFIAPPSLLILIAAREVPSDNFCHSEADNLLIIVDKNGVSRVGPIKIMFNKGLGASGTDFIALFMPKFVNQQPTRAEICKECEQLET